MKSYLTVLLAAGVLAVGSWVMAESEAQEPTIPRGEVQTSDITPIPTAPLEMDDTVHCPHCQQHFRIVQEERSFFEKLLDVFKSPWVLFGFAAQFMFFMRFFIQWIASERRKQSYIPVAFWYFSLAGGVMLFIYAVHRLDPVFIAGQGLGCVIYIRNLILIYRHRAAYREAQEKETEPEVL